MVFQPPPVKPLQPLDIADDELCRRYEALYTGAVNDVLREMQLLHQALPNSILPLERPMKVAGAAFTIKGMKSLTGEEKVEQRMPATEVVNRGGYF